MIDFNAMISRILNAISEDQTAALVPGSKLYMMAESLAYEALRIDSKLEEYYRSNNILSATGLQLDDIGRFIFGIQRFTAEKPVFTSDMKIAKFYVALGTFGEINRNSEGQPSSITVPAGTIISGSYKNKSYTFATNDSITLNANSNEAYFAARLISGDYNIIPTGTLQTHDFTGYTQSFNKTLLVNNPYPIATGRLDESDNDYRTRIMTSLRTLVDTSFYGIINKVRAIPGISDVQIINAETGGGSFKVVLQGITPTTADGLIAQATSLIAGYIPPWVKFEVVRPSYKGISCAITVQLVPGYQTSQDMLHSNIVNGISEYINNFYQGMFDVSQLETLASSIAGSDAYSVTLNYAYEYVGTGSFRDTISLTSDDTIFIDIDEKLIVEPVHDAISVVFTS